MPETWFTSDHHFGHKNILEYEPEARPFASIEEMHECLINNWNSVVADNDVVYHLGDFCFGKGYLSMASRLKGRKRLILGNHDTYPNSEYLRYFEKLHGVKYWNRCILSHMPVHPNQLGARWLLNIHGHLHSRKVRYPILAPDENNNLIHHEDLNYFNVSVEMNNLRPFHSDQIMSRLSLIDSM